MALRAVALLSLVADGMAGEGTNWRPTGDETKVTETFWRPGEAPTAGTDTKTVKKIESKESRPGYETHWRHKEGVETRAFTETQWKVTGIPAKPEIPRTQAASQTQSGAAGAAIKAWPKDVQEVQDSFVIQHLLDDNHNATLAPGLVLSQAIAMTVPNGGISVTVMATVLSNGTATNEALTTTLALLLHIPAGTISRFEVRPTPSDTVGFHFFIGSSGTPTHAAGESKETHVELVLSLAVAGLALVLLLHAVAVLVSRCQTPKVPKNNDIELEQQKSSVAA